MNERLPDFTYEELLAEISQAAKGLTYISENDSDVELFAADKSDSDDIRSAITKVDTRTPIEEIAMNDLFSRLTARQDWYGKDEIKRAERFARLQKLLEENLREVTVFKIGRVQKTIYVVGAASNNKLAGVKMNAVET